MIIRKLLFALCAVLLAFSSFADEELDQFFALGNDLYAQGEYETALEQYEAILERGYVSPEVFFNAGNCHFRLNHVASSILYFERANRLAPTDPDISFNLKLAYERTEDKVEVLDELFFVTWWKQLLNLFPADTWGWISWVFVLLLAGTFLGFLLSEVSGRKRLYFGLAGLNLILALLTFALGSAQNHQKMRTDQAIVFAESLSVKNGPSTREANNFVLHEGTKVKILETKDDWQRISLPDGKEGWVPAETIVSI